MNRNFWHGKRVLLTGHTGFKGSWLSIWLQSMGVKLVGYALTPPTNPSLFEAAQVGNDMTSVIGDIRDLTNLRNVFAEYQPEIVIHMAAQPLVRQSYIEPVETYNTNVMGTVNLLDSIRTTASVKAVVIVTSDKCYENREWVWGYRESEAMGGYDPYSSSKACAELITTAYRNSYFHSDQYLKHGVAIGSARAGNVIGGGDWAEDRLVPDMIRAIRQGRPVSIRNPNSIRPWQHVLEPLSGYLLLAQKLYEEGPSFAGAWNFGPNDDDAKPVKWVLDHFTQAWGNGASWELDSDHHPHEAYSLKLDCSKAKSMLKWEPVWSLTEAIARICSWHKSHLSDGNAYEMCLEQINEYESARYKCMHSDQ